MVVSVSVTEMWISSDELRFPMIRLEVLFLLCCRLFPVVWFFGSSITSYPYSSLSGFNVRPTKEYRYRIELGVLP